jgi:hypothetical protein
MRKSNSRKTIVLISFKNITINRNKIYKNFYKTKKQPSNKSTTKHSVKSHPKVIPELMQTD